MKLDLVRDAKVFNDPATGEQTFRLGYAMALFLHGLSRLRVDEPMPAGIMSATGDGSIPGIRKHLAADAMLIGFVEPVARRAGNPNRVYIRLTTLGAAAAQNHEVIGVKPPMPLAFLYRKMERLIEEQRAQRRRTTAAPSNGAQARRTA